MDLKIYETTDYLMFDRQIHAEMGIVEIVSNCKSLNEEYALKSLNKFEILVI